MAKIKRGVSLYSYQQAQYFGMTWKNMIREMHDNLKCTGVEVISESVIPRYPFGTDEFFYDWNNTMARYGMVPTVYNAFLDTLQFRDHVMNIDEAVERLNYDIRNAAKMGFKMVRPLADLPFEIFVKGLKEAEKNDITIVRELHDPNGFSSELCQECVEYIERSGCQHMGLLIDMSIFIVNSPKGVIDYETRRADDDMKKVIDYIYTHKDHMTNDEMKAAIPRELHITPEIWVVDYFGHCIPWSQPEDIKPVISHVKGMHAKFYKMEEVPGQPGVYHDPSINYEGVFKVLKECGWEGHVDSEFEGQRDYQDLGEENLIDEIDQVRKHHMMLRRLIGE